MVQVHFIDEAGETTTLDVPEGTSVMAAAVMNGLAGIVGECGGSAMCATCHVYVDAAFADRLSPPEPVEEEMLECTASERTEKSRLSCQITLTPELDGLVVRLPESQY